jgi:hypothetical protein
MAAVVGSALLALGVSNVFAGEVTGSGKQEDQNQGKSWCSFSGLNDDPGAPTDPTADPATMPNGPGGQSQSFGQENRLGFQDPHLFNPGTGCNPNRNPDPQPNRTK